MSNLTTEVMPIDTYAEDDLERCPLPLSPDDIMFLINKKREEINDLTLKLANLLADDTDD